MPPSSPLLTRASLTLGIVVALAGAAASGITWAYGRGTTEAEVSARIQAAEVRVEATEATIRRHDASLDELRDLPVRLDAIEREQARTAEDVRWLVRRQGGQPAGAP